MVRIDYKSRYKRWRVKPTRGGYEVSASPITITGNLTADPKLDFLTSGVAKLSFGVAVNHYWTNKDGEKEEKVSFFNCVAWRNLAEDSANVLSKGIKVVVTGRLEQRSWEDKEGIKRSSVEVLADNIGISTTSIESVTRRVRTEGATGSTPSGGSRTGKTGTSTKAKVSAQPTVFAEDGEEPF